MNKKIIVWCVLLACTTVHGSETSDDEQPSFFEEEHGFGFSFCHAASFGNLDKIKKLVAWGASVDVKGLHGSVPLLCALKPDLYREDQNIPVVEYLLSKRASTRLSIVPEVFGEKRLGPNEGALAVAVRRQVPKLVELLLLHKADPQERMDHNEGTVFNYAMKKSQELVKYNDPRGPHPTLSKEYEKAVEICILLKSFGAK